MNTFHEAKWISAGDMLQNERAYYEEKPAAIFQQTFVIEKEIKKASVKTEAFLQPILQYSTALAITNR